MAFETWLAFVTVWMVALIGIGANMLVCVTAGAMNGFRRGVWAATGLGTGSLLHSFIAAFGFSAVLTTSPIAYTMLQWVGGAYLSYLGIRQWRRPATVPTTDSTGHESRTTLYRRGLLTSLSNPQSFLWYLVFFAPFIDPGMPLVPQLGVLIPTAVLTAFTAFALYTALGLPIRRYLTSPERVARINRVAGSALIIFAILLVATSQEG